MTHFYSVLIIFSVVYALSPKTLKNMPKSNNKINQEITSRNQNCYDELAMSEQIKINLSEDVASSSKTTKELNEQIKINIRLLKLCKDENKLVLSKIREDLSDAYSKLYNK